MTKKMNRKRAWACLTSRCVRRPKEGDGKKVKAAKKGGKSQKESRKKQTSVSKESMAVSTVRIFLPSN